MLLLLLPLLLLLRGAALTDAEFGEDLERTEAYAFNSCSSLRRIAIPLKVIDFPRDSDNDVTQFLYCHKLATVDLVGGIHKAISSLHFESWKGEMKEEIDRINRDLPNTDSDLGTAIVIQQWIESVISRMEHYKTQHSTLLKEAITLLELALWKAKLLDKDNGNDGQEGARVTRGRVKRARKERCVTSGASIVIKNVLPFLQLAE